MKKLCRGAAGAACFLLLALIGTSPAAAGNEEENWDRCMRQDRVAPQSPEEVIAACRIVLNNIAFAPNERADAFNNIGVANLNLKNYTEAIRYFGEALRATREYQTIPEYRQLANYSRRNRARAYVSTKQYDKALNDFDTLASSEPIPKYLAERCLAHAMFDDNFASGLPDCKKAIDGDKTLGDAYTGWLTIEFRQGKFADVKSDCALIEQQITLTPDGKYVCGLADRRLGNTARGDSYIKTGLEFGMEFFDRFQELGMVP